jgi:MFS family permease
VALVVMAFFLSIYAANHLPVPLGWDTSKYLWRTSLLKAVGFAHMTEAVQQGIGVDPGRPAFPVIAATLSATLHVSPFRLAAVLPAVSAAAIGLGAGAFVSVTLRRPIWEFAATALFVGMSAFVVRLVGPETYQDNLFAAAVFVAAAVPIALSIADRRALIPAALLFGAGGVVHWAFFVFMVATLGLTAAAYLPASIRRWRAGEQAIGDTPSARLGGVVLGGIALAAVVVLGILHIPREPHLSASEFAKKLRQDIPKYKFPLMLPIAAIGAGSLAAASRRGKDDAEEGRSGTRFVLTLLLAWGAVTLGGYVAFKVLHLRVPAHRFLAFALAIPLLASLGVIAVGRLLARWGRPLAAVVVVAALGGAAFLSHRVLFGPQASMDPAKVTDAAQAGAYLQATRVGVDRPVVFIVGRADGSYTALMGHMIKASLPAERIGHVYLFIGTPQDYLAKRPLQTSTGPSALSVRYLQNLEPTYSQDPVALVLSSFNIDAYNQWIESHPEDLVARNVGLVRGPRPQTAVPFAKPPFGGLGGFWVGVLGVASMFALAAIGLGWAILLLGRWLTPLPLLGVSPAVGIAALVLSGILVDRVGIRLVGGGGILAVVVAAASSWGVLAIGRLRGRS